MSTPIDETHSGQTSAHQSLPQAGKKVYAPPTVTELGTLTDITRNVLPGETSDCLGTGFDPDPFGECTLS